LSATKHTETPWRLEHTRRFPRNRIVAEARQVHHEDGVTFEEPIVIADLIHDCNVSVLLAAPQLLNACHAALSLLRGSGFSDNTKAIIELKAAIAKADGS